MGILREFDAISYLQYASWYIEMIQVLEVTYPHSTAGFVWDIFL